MNDTQLQFIVDHLDDLVESMPAHTPTLVGTMPARPDTYAFRHRKNPLSVEAFGLWSNGAITPIVWAEDGHSVGLIPPEEVNQWDVGTHSAFGDPDA